MALFTTVHLFTVGKKRFHLVNLLLKTPGSSTKSADATWRLEITTKRQEITVKCPTRRRLKLKTKSGNSMLVF